MKHLPILLVGLAMQLGCTTSSEPSGPVEIRVANGGSVTLEQVVIGFPGGTEDYGSLPAEASSEYRQVETAYRYAAVSVEVDGKTLTLTPVDYVGETKLTAGRYTYILTVDPERTHLGLGFQQDE
jgi:hypothetical protein